MLNHRSLYGIDDKPPIAISLFIALQHLLAVFGGIVAAPLIIAHGMGLSVEDTSYLVSSSLFVSGLATFVQINRLGPIGSGLLSIQGTSFTFIGPLISAYLMLVEGKTGPEAMGTIFGACAVCALIVGFTGQFVEHIRKVLTPNVTGTTVVLIGMSLVWTTLNNIAREIQTSSGSEVNTWQAILTAIAVFCVTLIMSFSKNIFLRVLSITTALFIGFCLALVFGMVDFSKLDNLPLLFLPSFNYFPISFNLSVVLMLLPIFFLSSIETIGDLTATSKLSLVSIEGRDYWKRIRAGISGDAFNSLLAAILCTFPNTSFSQNNGVIRLTGVSSRYVGRFVALLLCVLGLFPIIGGLFIVIPGVVLYGATTLMFCLVLVSGLAIIQANASDDNRWLVVGVSVVAGWGISLGVGTVNVLPNWLANILAFPISTGAIVAMLIESFRSLAENLRHDSKVSEGS